MKIPSVNEVIEYLKISYTSTKWYKHSENFALKVKSKTKGKAMYRHPVPKYLLKRNGNIST